MGTVERYKTNSGGKTSILRGYFFGHDCLRCGAPLNWGAFQHRKPRWIRKSSCHGGSRNQAPKRPDFRRRYSAWLASARAASEMDFWSFAILMASRNAVSISVLSATIAARNTPRSRSSSAHHQRASDVAANVSASRIASRASMVRSARCKASAFSASQYGTSSSDSVVDLYLNRRLLHLIRGLISPRTSGCRTVLKS
jgi:hypothetical protein